MIVIHGIDQKHHRLSRFTKLLCVLTIVGLLDAHITLMQTWAWITMLNDRIPEQGIEQAFESTFSGDYPCDTCRAVAELKAKQIEQQSKTPFAPQQELKSTAKLIGVIPHSKSTKLPLPLCSRIPFEAIHMRALDDLISSVPSPPPQVV